MWTTERMTFSSVWSGDDSTWITCQIEEQGAKVGQFVQGQQSIGVNVRTFVKQIPLQYMRKTLQCGNSMADFKALLYCVVCIELHTYVCTNHLLAEVKELTTAAIQSHTSVPSHHHHHDITGILVRHTYVHCSLLASIRDSTSSRLQRSVEGEWNTMLADAPLGGSGQQMCWKWSNQEVMADHVWEKLP